MIPFAGWAATAGKGVKYAAKGADALTGALKYGDEAAAAVKGAARYGDEIGAAGQKYIDDALDAFKKSLDGSAGKVDDVVDSAAKGAGDKGFGKIYTPVEYNGTVKVNGEVKDVSRRIYQRNDIDINYFDETTGLTNFERMQAGKPPIGTDGDPLELHHVLQQEAGPMAELREITHQQYYSQLHGLVENGASFRNNPLLNKQYNNFRYNYWKWRASLITGGK